MKRVTYISSSTRDLSPVEVEQLGEYSIENNQNEEITGVLLYLNGIFFKIIEGKSECIDRLYKKILADERHTNILCLKSEYNIQDRLFPNWSMKVIDTHETVEILRPIKSLLQTITESHRILEYYTQPSVIHILNQGINPLSVLPQTINKVVFFSDILSFSTFTEKLPVAEVVTLVNQYFSICSDIIVAHGGEVDKFMGDCVMASFLADQADAAIEASLALLAALKQLRQHAEAQSPSKMLYTGIGLSYGPVIEGNMGSGIKMDYTLIGDSVNVAARLEALTRHLSRALALTAELKAQTQKNWNFIALGEHQVKGKQTPVEVYTLDDELTHLREAPVLAQLIGQTLEKRARLHKPE
ncbi:MAG: BLUF domain-containing protein, partial [Pseudomonadota bacterium]|nr:BLUF domain-containing protein [Pseudomonadota bacterium]